MASRLPGVSGRAMIEALIAGERNPGRLADLALGRLRRKTEELQLACDGRFTAAHGQMCRLHLDAYDHLTAKIAELDALVAEAAAPFAALIARLETIPGIGRRTAEVIVAETGGDMARFATAARLAAWAGLAPGDNESAGKRKHAAARKGNRHLRVAMAEAAWATARTRTRPGARFRRLARRFGKGNEKKAALAVAHTLICIAWAVLSRGEDYAEAGEDYYEQRNRRDREHLIRHHQQALARLGCQVTLIPPGDGSPPPSATSQQPALNHSVYHRRAINSRLRRRCRAPVPSHKFPHRPDVSPVGVDRGALCAVAGRCCGRWSLLLLSPLLSTRRRPSGSKPTRTLQGMARVRFGQTPTWPLSSDRRGCRGSDAQGVGPEDAFCEAV